VCNKFVTFCIYYGMLPAAALATDCTSSYTNNGGFYGAATNRSPSFPSCRVGIGGKVFCGGVQDYHCSGVGPATASVAYGSSSTKASVPYRARVAAGTSRGWAVSGTVTKIGGDVLQAVGDC